MASTPQKVAVKDATDADLYTHAAVTLGLQVEPDMPRSRLVAALGQAGVGSDDMIEAVRKPVAHVAAKKPAAKAAEPAEPEEDDEDLDLLEDDERVRRLRARDKRRQAANARALDEEVLLTIPIQDKPGGDEPVPVGHQGRVIWLTRGELISVKKKHLRILERAVEFRYEWDQKNPLGGLTPPRKVHSYPFSMAGPA
jgi:hypothetical protein